jgi:hypothetical protein
MGSIKNVETGQTRALECDHVVGRSVACALHIEDRSVSARHAAFAWRGDHWEIKDLGSRNGTYVDGVRLGSGEHRAVRSGTRVAFGRREVQWEVVDASAPRVMAICTDGGQAVELDEELIALPSADDPHATIYRAGEGAWVLEQSMSVTPVADQQMFTVDGRSWKFCCPEMGTATALTSLLPLEVSDLTLTFSVSKDEEYVRIEAAAGARLFDFGEHSYHYLLLTLARHRLADSKEGVPESSCGWVYQEDLSHDPSMAPPQLNLDVYRLRKEFAARGIVDAASIVERRPRTRQLRIGSGRLKIIVL